MHLNPKHVLRNEIQWKMHEVIWLRDETVVAILVLANI